MDERYNFHAIERKWRQEWEEHQEPFAQVDKLDMSGLRRLWAGDVARRYRKMRYGRDNQLSIDVGPVVFLDPEDVVTPDYAIEMYGADATRLYLMFAAPLRREVKWDISGVEGAYKFINRVWDLGAALSHTLNGEVKTQVGEVVLQLNDAEERNLWRCVQKTLRYVSEQLERGIKYNTAISAIMMLVKSLEGYWRKRARENTASLNAALITRAYDLLLCMLAPIIPYVAEELWLNSGHHKSVHDTPWPQSDETALQEAAVNVVVEIDGKLCQVLRLPANSDGNMIQQVALRDGKVKARLTGRRIQRVIIRPRLINFVTEAESD